MKFKILQVVFNSTVLIPGFVKNETSVSMAKHKGVELAIDDKGVIITAGKTCALVPLSNVKVVLFEQVPDADGK